MSRTIRHQKSTHVFFPAYFSTLCTPSYLLFPCDIYFFPFFPVSAFFSSFSSRCFQCQDAVLYSHHQQLVVVLSKDLCLGVFVLSSWQKRAFLRSNSDRHQIGTCKPDWTCALHWNNLPLTNTNTWRPNQWAMKPWESISFCGQHPFHVSNSSTATPQQSPQHPQHDISTKLAWFLWSAGATFGMSHQKQLHHPPLSASIDHGSHSISIDLC